MPLKKPQKGLKTTTKELKMHCRDCGQKINDNDKFCSSCGASQGSHKNDKTVELEKTNKEIKAAFLALGILGLFGIFFIIHTPPLGIFIIIITVIGLIYTNARRWWHHG